MKDIKLQILNKIKEYDRIIISRHIRPDGDAVGSTKGICTVLRASFPEKEIYLVNDDYSDYMAFHGPEDTDVPDEKLDGALLIVLDTATRDRISNHRADLAREIIKIDHHVDIKPYGDISWVEDQRSSCCELVADFCLSFKDELKLAPEAAKYIYTGMVTDSGRFKFNSVSGETLRLAGAMLDLGIDTDRLFAELYLEDFDILKFKAHVYKKMKITKNGVAHIYVDLKMQERFNLTPEQASATVSALDSIRGSIVWIAFIENRDGSIRVRLRSRFMTINKLAERYHGGGHECAAGATCYSVAEKTRLLREADALIKKYKEENEGWL